MNAQAASSDTARLPLEEQVWALRRLALVATRATGQEVFQELVDEVARALGVRSALVAVFVEGDRTRMRTLAAVMDGQPMPPIEYALARSPCVEVVGKGYCFMPHGVVERFGGDAMVSQFGLDAYAAFPMNNRCGEPLGLVGALDPQMIAGGDADHAEAVLKIAAVRLGAELERQAAEAQLRASEEQYRAIFNASEDALVLWNDRFQRVDVNPAHERLYGFSRAELLGRAYEDMPYALELAEARLALVRRAMAGEACHAELRALKKDGSFVLTELRAIPFQHGGARHVLTIARDITERKAAEARLREQEQRYRTIFDSSADPMTVWNRQLEVIDVNRAFEDVKGYAREQIVGRHASLRADATDMHTILPFIEAAFAGHASHTVQRVSHAHGHQIEMELRYLPIRLGGEDFVLGIGRDITERSAAEARLRASEEQYRAIFDASADALAVRDAEFRVVDVNPAYEAISGRRRADVIGLVGQTVNEDSSVDRFALHARALAGEPIRIETAGQRPDGTPLLLEVRGVPMTYRGEPHVLYVGRDVTDARLAERALRASWEQYRAIFNAWADAVVLRAADFSIVDVNATYEAMSGYKLDEVLGVDRVLANPPEVGPVIRALHERALGGEPISLDTVLVRRDGQRYDLELRGVPIQHRGQPHVVYIGRDITQRKKAETALRASEEQYRAIFNASADALMLWDRHLRRVDVNPAHERIFGYTRDEVVGRGFEGLDYPEDMVQQRVQMLQRALQGEALQVEVEAMRKDGRRIVTELRTVPFQHRDEPHVLQIARDITAQRAAQAERAALESQLRQAQKMEAIGQLTGGIAHDFNNILTSVIGYLVLAQERSERFGDASLARQLGSAHTAAQRARELIAQMLAFARRQRGDRRVIALPAVVRQSLQLLRATLPTSIVLDDRGLDVDEALPPVRADTVQIEQVLFNLCINARDAMPRSGRIAVRLDEHHAEALRCASCGNAIGARRWLRLSVSDTGIGIDPAVVPRMFEPFFTTKEVGRGSGMGLAMVHGIVHEHEGHIVVDTAPGRGTNFHVLLPVADGAAEAALHGASATVDSAPMSGRVMVVEDEAMVAEFMRELLEGWGLEVVVPPDALAAARWFDDPAHEVDLLITDLTMPQMNGLDLAHHVAVQRPNLPVLLYSGDTVGVDADALRRAGVRAMLSKPVDPPQLRAMLRRWLGAR